MNIQVTARHFHASTELQDNINGKVKGLETFHHGITDVLVVLDAQKERVRHVELRVNVVEKTLSATAEEENMHDAIEAAFAKMERQLKKENEKSHSHRAPAVADLV